MEKQINISAGENKLSATLHYPQNIEKEQVNIRYPAIIICHGFIGNHIGANRLFINTAREFAENGYYVLRFDYGGCGESTGDFGASSLKALIEQTRYVLDYLLDIDGLDRARIIFLGHNLGGTVALLTAVRDKRVSKLILWSPIGHPLNDIMQVAGRAVYEEVVTKGSSDYHGYTFQSSFFHSLSDYDPFQEARSFTGDVLLIHGAADNIILEDNSTFYQKVFWTRENGHCDKKIIAHADHSFSTSEHTHQVIHETLEWLEQLEHERDQWYGWMI